MATKTTGAEFKRFYTDPKYWPADSSQGVSANVWHEDETVLINGEPLDPSASYSDIPDNADVRVEGGIVFGPKWRDNEPSLEAYFKRWRKEQTLKSFIVECDESKLDAVLEAIKAAGGKVLK